MPATFALVTPWYKHRWPWLLMLGPARVVVASSISAWLAVTRADPLVEGDYYKRGKAINQDLRRDRAATARGLGLALAYDAAGGRLRGTVTQRSGAGAGSGSMTLLLAHPTQPARDMRILVTPDSGGHFDVALPMLERARWQVLLEDAARSWRLEGYWVWPAERMVAISADAS